MSINGSMEISKAATVTGNPNAGKTMKAANVAPPPTPATPNELIATISNGRTGVMPVLAPALGGDEGIDNMVSYVQSLSGIVEPDADAMSAKPMFLALCSACHNADGTGNPIFGAPNLTDDIWLYGSSDDAIRTTTVQGRNGIMPAHGALLGDNRTKILAAYIYSLSN